MVISKTRIYRKISFNIRMKNIFKALFLLAVMALANVSWAEAADNFDFQKALNEVEKRISVSGTSQGVFIASFMEGDQAKAIGKEIANPYLLFYNDFSLTLKSNKFVEGFSKTKTNEVQSVPKGR